MSGFYSYENQLPTKSSDILKTIFNLKVKSLNKTPRRITELNPAKTQGQNALLLAKFIVLKGKYLNNLNYSYADKYIKDYESNTCYICGNIINTKTENRVEELEHIMPLAEGLAFSLIIQNSSKIFQKTFDSIFKKPIARGYLLEYRRSHKCCNRLKGVTSFFTFDGTPNSETPYKIDENFVSSLLKKIWENARIDGKLYQDSYGCKEPELLSSMKDKEMNNFVNERKQIIINDYLNPLLTFILDNIDSWGKGNLSLAQLVMISNQAITINQNIWKKMGVQSTENNNETPNNENISNKYVLDELLQKSSAEECSNSMMEILQSVYNSSNLNNVITDYFKQKTNSRLKNTFDNWKTFIMLEYYKMQNLLNNNMEQYDININNIVNPGCYFGMLYMTILLSNNNNIEFKKNMINDFVNMMQNVNNYCVLTMYLYILHYNPFKSGVSSIKNDEMFETMIKNTNEIYQYNHEEYTINTFPGLQYINTIKQKNNPIDLGLVVDIRVLSTFMKFIFECIVKQRTAEIMVINLHNNTVVSPIKIKPLKITNNALAALNEMTINEAILKKMSEYARDVQVLSADDLSSKDNTSILPNFSEQNSLSLQEQPELISPQKRTREDSTLSEQRPTKQSRKNNGGKKHRHLKTLRKISRKYTRKYRK